MDLKEMYSIIGGNYEDAIGRVFKEDRLIKYLKMFSQSEEFERSISAYKSNDFKRLFLESHSLKGMAANLGFTRLYNSASALCESVRQGTPDEDISNLIEKVSFDYGQTIDAINSVLK